MLILILWCVLFDLWMIDMELMCSLLLVVMMDWLVSILMLRCVVLV